MMNAAVKDRGTEDALGRLKEVCRGKSLKLRELANYRDCIIFRKRNSTIFIGGQPSTGDILNFIDYINLTKF